MDYTAGNNKTRMNGGAVRDYALGSERSRIKLEELRERFRAFNPNVFFEKLKKADVIYVVFSCSDARVGGKTEYTLKDGRHAVVDWVPNIGGNAPSAEELRMIIDVYAGIGVSMEKVVFVSNGHGTKQEIGGENIINGCGARVAGHEIASGKTTVKEFAHHHHVPLATVKAAGQSHVYDIHGRVDEVKTLLIERLKSIGVDAQVAGSTFNNNTQVLAIDGIESLRTHDKEWELGVQQPETIVVCVGSILSVVPDEEVYANARDKAGEIFNSESPLTVKFIKQFPDMARQLVLTAFAEAGYAIGQSITAKGQDGNNFSKTESFILAVDNEEILRFVLEVLSSDDEDAQEIRKFLLNLKGAGVDLFVTILENDQGQRDVRMLEL